MTSSRSLLVVLCFCVLALCIQQVHGSGYGCSQTCTGADVNYVLEAKTTKYVMTGSHKAFDQEDDAVFYTRTWVDGGSESPLCTLNDADTGMLGPCMQVKPGQTLNIKVINNMVSGTDPVPPTPDDWIEAIQIRYNTSFLKDGGFNLYNKAVQNTSQFKRDVENEPTDFDNTNLHLHGVQIEPHMYYPQGTHDPESDWITITPSGSTQCFCYEFTIPADHAPGTFIYHMHRHGAVAVQGWSGMFGYFLVRGGLENELANYGVTTELPFMIWDPHLSTNVGDVMRKFGIHPGHIGAEHSTVRSVREGDIAKTKLMSQKFLEKFGANPDVSEVTVTDFLSGQTDTSDSIIYLVNNEYQPSYAFETNETIWFRLVCGTTENLCHFRVVDADHNIVPFHNVGSDGISFTQAWKRENLYLGGGMREEVLLRFEKPGDYSIIMVNITTVQFFGTGPDNQLLASVTVTDGSQPEPVAFEDMSFTSGMAAADDIDFTEITNRRTVQFGMNSDVRKLPFPQYVINDKSFNHSHIDESVSEGEVEEWIIYNAEKAVHPYHVHVNSFQVKEVQSAFEQDNSFTEFITDYEHPPNRWRDVVLVPPMGFVRIWMRFGTQGHNWTGKTIFHCHFLAHEETGMIANLMINDKEDEQ